MGEGASKIKKAQRQRLVLKHSCNSSDCGEIYDGDKIETGRWMGVATRRVGGEVRAQALLAAISNMCQAAHFRASVQQQPTFVFGTKRGAAAPDQPKPRGRAIHFTHKHRHSQYNNNDLMRIGLKLNLIVDEHYCCLLPPPSAISAGSSTTSIITTTSCAVQLCSSGCLLSSFEIC